MPPRSVGVDEPGEGGDSRGAGPVHQKAGEDGPRAPLPGPAPRQPRVRAPHPPGIQDGPTQTEPDQDALGHGEGQRSQHAVDEPGEGRLLQASQAHARPSQAVSLAVVWVPVTAAQPSSTGSTLERVLEIVRGVAGRDRTPPGAGAGTRLWGDGFWLDSIDLLDVMLACDEAFGPVFASASRAAMADIKTVGDLVSVIEGRGRPSGPPLEPWRGSVGAGKHGARSRDGGRTLPAQRRTVAGGARARSAIPRGYAPRDRSPRGRLSSEPERRQEPAPDVGLRRLQCRASAVPRKGRRAMVHPYERERLAARASVARERGTLGR
jgi:acyl carrier protein